MWTLRSFNPKQYFYGPPIQITSPEQYVPLFLAYMSPNGEKDVNTGAYYTTRTSQEMYIGYEARIDTGLYLDLDRDGYVRKNEDNKRNLKRAFMYTYDHSYPSSYSLPIHRAYINPSVSDQAPAAVFCEKYFMGDLKYHYLDPDRFTLPGLVAEWSRLKVQSLSNVWYTQNTLVKGTLNMNPEILIVVKAKQIPILRVALGLSVGSKIPIPDIKILRVDSMNVTQLSKQLLVGPIREFTTAEETSVQYTSKEEMLSYLFGPTKPQTSESYLQKAIALTTGQDLLATMNV